MMKKNYINSFILSVFCLNVLFLVFSSGTNEFLKLSSSLLTIIGLVWLIYFYLQLLEQEDNFRPLDNNLKSNDFNLEFIPDTEIKQLFPNLIAFSSKGSSLTNKIINIYFITKV